MSQMHQKDMQKLEILTLKGVSPHSGAQQIIDCTSNGWDIFRFYSTMSIHDMYLDDMPSDIVMRDEYTTIRSRNTDDLERY